MRQKPLPRLGSVMFMNYYDKKNSDLPKGVFLLRFLIGILGGAVVFCALMCIFALILSLTRISDGFMPLFAGISIGRFVFRRVSDGTSDKEQRTPKRNNMRGVLCAYPHSRLHNLQRARRRRSACIRAVCRGDLHGVSRRNFRGQLGKIVF